MNTENLFAIAKQFRADGQLISIEQITSGHINKTFRLDYQSDNGAKSYLLQWVNDYVFKNIPGLMENIKTLLNGLRLLPIIPGRFRGQQLSLIPTIFDNIYLPVPEGGCWRMFNYISGGIELAKPSLKEVESAAWAFGSFEADLATFDCNQFTEVIPNYHNLPARFLALQEALENGIASRILEVKPLLPQIKDLISLAGIIPAQISAGVIPKRLVHNDPKFTNILFDRQLHQPLAVLDLDTVMPGSILYDYGDMIRSGAAIASEDQEAGMALDFQRIERIKKGFLAPIEEILTPQEQELMPLGPLSVTTELSIRFFTDYLLGDKYFYAHHPQHNLQRGRAQLILAKCMREML